MDGLHIKRAFAGSPYARFPGFEPLTSPEVQLLRLPDDDVSSVDGIGSPAQKLVSPYIRPSCEALKSFGTYENWKKRRTRNSHRNRTLSQRQVVADRCARYVARCGRLFYFFCLTPGITDWMAHSGSVASAIISLLIVLVAHGYG